MKKHSFLIAIKRALAAFLTALVFVSSSAYIIPFHATAEEIQTPKPDVWVDTDPGVVDTFALAYLLQNPDVNLQGISVVFGDSTVENEAQNVLTLMDVINRHDVPLYIGAAQPLVKPATNVGMLIHGFDGIWGQQVQHDLSSVPTDAPAAIAEAARNHPGMIVLAIGPATNIALAVQRFPEDMKTAKIYMLAEITGNEYHRLHSDPFSGGFNTWIDPDAVDVILNADGLDFTIFRGGVYDGITVDANEYATRLLTEGGSLGQFLAAMAIPSWQMSSQGAGGPEVLDDLILAILATHPEYFTETIKGYGRVSTHQDFTGGTYYFASDPYSKVVLLASGQELSDLAYRFFTEPDFNLQLELFLIMSRKADNLNVVLDLKGNKVQNIINTVFFETQTD